MIRTLLIITGASLVLCIAALAGAAALGGQDMARHGWTWTLRGHGDGQDETIRFQRADSGPRVTRTLAWDGSDRLSIDVTADVTYVQGDAASVEISGPRDQVEGLRLSGGRLTFDDDDDTNVVMFGWRNHDRLRITVTAPSISRFDLSSSGDLSIRGYDQPTLFVAIDGSGDVEASGRTEALELDISGSGEADLSALETRDADVEISGSGEAAVGPTGAARISISGSGDVDLTRRPASLTQTISGSGDVSQR